MPEKPPKSGAYICRNPGMGADSGILRAVQQVLCDSTVIFLKGSGKCVISIFYLVGPPELIYGGNAAVARLSQAGCRKYAVGPISAVAY